MIICTGDHLPGSMPSNALCWRLDERQFGRSKEPNLLLELRRLCGGYKDMDAGGKCDG